MARKILIAAMLGALALSPFDPASASNDCGAPTLPMGDDDQLCHDVPFVGTAYVPNDCSHPIGPGWICYTKPYSDAIATPLSMRFTPGAFVGALDRGNQVVLYGRPVGGISYLLEMRWRHAH